MIIHDLNNTNPSRFMFVNFRDPQWGWKCDEKGGKLAGGQDKN